MGCRWDDSAMKILSFMNPVRFGGGERLMLDLGDYFRSQKVDFLVINLNRSLEFDEKLDGHAIRHVNIGNKGFKQTPRKSEYLMLMFRVLGRIPSIRKVVAAEHPDVVLANGFPSILLVALALSFMAKPPRMVYVHHFMKAKERAPVAVAYAFLLGRYDRIIAVSSRTKETLVAQFPRLQHKMVSVPNGIDCARFDIHEERHALRQRLNLPEGVLAICVGRLVAFKNQKALIELAANMEQKDFHVIIAGDGDDYQMLHDTIAERALDGRVQLLGPIDSEELPLYLRAADIFAYPSLKEGFGIVIAEAMAAYLPTVILRDIYIPEFGDGAIIAKDIDEFEAVIKHLAADGKLRRHLGMKARGYAEANLDISVTGRKFLEAIC